MESAVFLAALATLASKIFELLKRAKAKDANGAISILSIWVTGAIVVLIAAHATVTKGLAIPGTLVTFGALDGWSQVLLGLTLGSFISFSVDIRKSIDNTDSAAQPRLLGTSPQTPPQQ